MVEKTDKPFRDQYAEAMGKLGLNIHDYKGIADQVNSMFKKDNKNMALGGEVVPQGQEDLTIDPSLGQEGTDTVNRNLEPQEFVLDVQTVQSVGVDVLQALQKLVNDKIQTGQDPAVIGQVMQDAVASLIQEAQTSSEGQPAPDQGAAPPTGMTSQPATTGPVELPSGTGQARPNPVL